ncbi:hypothetical protein KVT40_003508 [Elsinoe batatas]|uniref:Uncharacterized protein n=1 Tax=Elsinoe batatas TaxID=2601811 RepID=A0A8K0L7P8_9PEZI|nr:hypothetical protein KVT40_003508 [Elsinoe batatas]
MQRCFFHQGGTNEIDHREQRVGTVNDKEYALRRRLGCGYKDAEHLQPTSISSEARPLRRWKHCRPSFLQLFASPSQDVINAVRKTIDSPNINKRLQFEQQVIETRVHRAVDGDEDAITKSYAR